MQVITTERVQLDACGKTLTVAERGETLTVVSEGFGVYEVENVCGTRFTVSKSSVEEK